MSQQRCKNAGRTVYVGMVRPTGVSYAIPKEQETITCAACGKELKRTTLLGEVLATDMTRLFEYVRYHKTSGQSAKEAE